MFQTNNGKFIDIEELNWEEASSILRPLNAELVDIIDQLSPDNEYKLYKAKYHFGSKIIDNGRYQLPLTNGRTVAFNSSSLPKQLYNNLSYDFLTQRPFGIVINKKAELYLSLESRIIPHSVFTPGKLFGVSQLLDNINIKFGNRYAKQSYLMWEMTAGCRSLLMLPKINDKLMHKRLIDAYNISKPTPLSYQDHWSIFRDIAIKQRSNWRLEVLFFCNKWLDSITDPAWSKLYNYLLNYDRSTNLTLRDDFGWQIMFNDIEIEKNLKFPPYTLYTAKHLFNIASGIFPGFKPATNEAAAPIKLIQDAYINEYKLSYVPIIMELDHIDYMRNIKQPVYYSVNYPTLPNYNLHALKHKSLINVICEIQYAINTYQKMVKEGFLADSICLNTDDLMVDFAYYHTESDGSFGIKNSLSLATEDPRFMANSDAEFPNHGAFLKGCIKINI